MTGEPMKPLSQVRSWVDLLSDETGQITTEWVLVTGTIVFPICLAANEMITMLDSYFYRIAGVVALPFP